MGSRIPALSHHRRCSMSAANLVLHRGAPRSQPRSAGSCSLPAGRRTLAARPAYPGAGLRREGPHRCRLRHREDASRPVTRRRPFLRDRDAQDAPQRGREPRGRAAQLDRQVDQPAVVLRVPRLRVRQPRVLGPNRDRAEAHDVRDRAATRRRSARSSPNSATTATTRRSASARCSAAS